MEKDGRYTCEPFEFAIASLDEVFVFHLGIVNLQDTSARGLLLFPVITMPVFLDLFGAAEKAFFVFKGFDLA